MDLALAIEKIYPNAEYFGATTENSKTDFDNLNWQDERPKPSWKQVQDAWIKYESDLAKEVENKTAAKSELLAKLGISAEEAALLLA